MSILTTTRTALERWFNNLANFMDCLMSRRRYRAKDKNDALRKLEKMVERDAQIYRWLSIGSGVMALFWIAYIIGQRSGPFLPVAITFAITCTAVAVITQFHRNQSSALIENVDELLRDKHEVSEMPGPFSPLLKPHLEKKLDQKLAEGVNERFDEVAFLGTLPIDGKGVREFYAALNKDRLMPLMMLTSNPFPTARPATVEEHLAAQRAGRLPNPSKVESDPHVHRFHRDDEEEKLIPKELQTVFDRYEELTNHGSSRLDAIGKEELSAMLKALPIERRVSAAQEEEIRYADGTWEPVNSGPEVQPFGIYKRAQDEGTDTAAGKHRAG